LPILAVALTPPGLNQQIVIRKPDTETLIGDDGIGEPGSDCLWDMSGAAFAFDCGAGSDRYVPAALSYFLRCEQPVTTCDP
jgi:hypothetical protein